MLSLFPEILFLSPFAALSIRVALALLLALSAWRHISRVDTFARIWSFPEAVVAAALFAGAWTQGCALIGLVLLIAGLFLPKMRVYPLTTTLLALVMMATLVVTGAGAFAFDLPL